MYKYISVFIIVALCITMWLQLDTHNISKYIMNNYIHRSSNYKYTKKEVANIKKYNTDNPQDIPTNSVYDIYKAKYVATDTGKVIMANLDEKILVVLENGQTVKTIDIVSIGKPDKYYETPGGIYKIKGWETEHYSSLGHVYMPWSMQFSGNYFIHGIPYHDIGNGIKERVSTQYSGGCIRLADNDAKYIYDFSDKSTMIIVSKAEDRISNGKNNTEEIDNDEKMSLDKIAQSYKDKSYIVMDLSTNIYTSNFKKENLTKENIVTSNIGNLAIAYTSLDNVSQERTVNFNGEKVKMLNVLPYTLSGDVAALSLSVDYIGPRLFQAYLDNKLKAIGTVDTQVDVLSHNSTTTLMDMLTIIRYTYIYKPYIMSIDNNIGTNNIWTFDLGLGYVANIIKGSHRDFLVISKS